MWRVAMLEHFQNVFYISLTLSFCFCVFFLLLRLRCPLFLGFFCPVGIRNMNSKDGMSMEEMRKLIEK